MRMIGAAAAAAVVMVAACGGGGGGPASFSVGGNVTGLSGTGLVLTNNGGDALPISTTGAFTFATPVASGKSYAVSVSTQPINPGQTCTVSNGSGTVNGANVTSVVVQCVTAAHPVGGTVSGLTGTGLALQNNGSDQLAISADGSFQFATQVPEGAQYHVTVVGQPTNPVQNCTVKNGTAQGTVSNANVSSVAVVCANIGRFAYVSNEGDNTISAYAINPDTGALTSVTGSPFPTKRAHALAVDRGGQFLYTANFDSTGVSAYTIDKNTGALAEVTGSPFAAGTAPLAVAVDPNGRFVYVANVNSGDVSAYTIDSTTGALTAIAGSPFIAGYNPSSVTVDPSGKFAYVTNSNGSADNISAYTIDATTGALTALATGPFATGAQPYSIVVTPSGKYVYVANNVSGNVSAYSIDGANGSLTALAASPYAAGPNPTSVTVDPSGTFVYVANSSGIGAPGGNDVSAYTINASTGALTPVTGSPYAPGMNPSSVRADPSGKFLYVASEDPTGEISAFVIDATTGALTPVAGSPFPAGHNSSSIAVSR